MIKENGLLEALKRLEEVQASVGVAQATDDSGEVGRWKSSDYTKGCGTCYQFLL